MNKTLIWTGILVIAVILGIGAAAFVSPMLSQSQTASLGYSAQRQSFVTPPIAATIQPTLVAPSVQQQAPDALPAVPSQNGEYQRGYGMGPGMMGNYGHGYGMMGGYGNNQSAPSAAPLTADQAKAAAEAYIQSSGLTGLKVAEIMVFDNNAYVAVTESETGRGAFELLVDPYSPQFAYPEYGPNMMWNLKYGMMGRRGGMGMMGNWNGRNTTPANPSAQMNITQEQAIQFAQAYLDQFVPGATAATDPLAFYGYYTLDFEKNGQMIGMLSVNGFTGQVFPHTWHNLFISETRYDQ
jgi:hypothetical protein